MARTSSRWISGGRSKPLREIPKRFWIFGSASLAVAILIGAQVYWTSAQKITPMSLARVAELQVEADQACKCARSSEPNSAKHRECWSGFAAAAKPYASIKGPQLVAACVGWEANDTLSFGPPVAQRLEKERRYQQFLNKNARPGVPIEIPSYLDDTLDRELSDEAPQWTVTTRRIHGGCSIAEEASLIRKEREERARRIAAHQSVSPTC
jgi:hypothetical protein